MDYTADELAYERYKQGEYTYEDYCDVCKNEEVEPRIEVRETEQEIMDLIKEVTI